MKKKQNCQERDAYCANLGNTCFCQCLSGYIMVNGHCLLGNISEKNQWMLFLSTIYVFLMFQSITYIYIIIII